MILSPNEFALIRDDTKGEVNTHVGPLKTSLATSDQPVIFDEKTKLFTPCSLQRAVQTLKTAPEGFYVILKNPQKDLKQPMKTGKLSTPDLDVGRKINLPGPVSFALHPGQMAQVVKGHHLKSNEYLIVRVYDEKAARESGSAGIVVQKSDAPSTSVANVFDPARVTMGELFVIKGTDVSFYIPPTGIEVVQEGDRYVRQAVTLERLEYCLLLDQNGNKRYEMGPKVVFPRPTETFVEKSIKSDPEKAKAKKFRAVELSETSGIYIKVIADYTEGEKKYVTGDELFITGRDQMIYFPRDEHAIIKYGEQEIHFGIAIPAGESRYVLNRKDGNIRLEKGPKVFLPDPRTEVIVKRVLPLDTCEYLYPGNADARNHNAALLGESSNTGDLEGGGGAEHDFLRSNSGVTYAAAAAVATPDMDKRAMIRGASKTVAGDAFDRKNKFTKPRSVVLNTRFDGAVAINVWNGYAVKLVRKDGSSRVVVGPQTAILEYDEEPQVLAMSRGKPKGSHKPALRTVYLRVTNNRIGDQLEVETSDFVKLTVDLSYRLNFVGAAPEKWFDVDDYVKFMCDNMRSKIRNAVRKFNVRDFYNSGEDILRDVILGKSGGEGTKRPGTKFEECNLHVYDVEVLSIRIDDQQVDALLTSAQRTEIKQSVDADVEKARVEFTKQIETAQFDIEQLKHETFLSRAKLKAERLEIEAKLADKEAELTAMKARAAHERDNEAAQAAAALRQIELDTAKKQLEQAEAHDAVMLQNLVTRLTAETKSAVERGGAFSPALIAALQGATDAKTIEAIAAATGPLQVLGINTDDGGVIGSFGKLLAGTPLGKRLETTLAGATEQKAAKNGGASHAKS